MGTKATFGGVPLTNATSVSWSLSVGTEPYQGVFVVHESNAKALRSQIGDAHPLSLVIEPEGQPALKVKRLFIVGEAPAPEPYLAAFYVQDGRYLWRRKWVYRHFNVPRRTGNRRLIGGIPTEIDTGIDSFAYADWSLKGAKDKWTAKDALFSVLDAVTDGNFEIKGDVPDIPIQGVEIDDAGGNALARILAHIGGWDVVLDYDGTAIAFDANDLQGAARLMTRKNPPLNGSEKPVKSDLSAIRPSKVIALFNREVELRFNSVTESESVTRGAGDLDMENVLPVPDDRLTITEGGKTRVVTRGTIIPVRVAIAAWSSDLPTGTNARLTFDLIRRLYLRGSLLESLFGNYHVRSPSVNWIARLACLRAHYRLTYQIAHKWMRRIKGLRARRLGVYDPVSGVFAPAGVFMDYGVLYSTKGLISQASDGSGTFLSANVHGFPGVGISVDGTSAKQAPAVLHVLDEALGVVHIDLRLDTLGMFQTVVPSLIVDESGAETSVTANPADARRFPIALDAKVRGTNAFVGLSSSHKVAIVLTAIPASPNDESLLHDVEAKTGNVKGTGKEWRVRIGAGLQTARLLWMEGKESVYRGVFGVDDPSKGVATAAVPKSMVVNSEILQDTADAKASALLSTMLDHYDGTKTTHWDPSAELVPRGNVDVVTHVLTPDGVLVTTVRATPTLAGRDMLAFLPDSVRTQVFRILPPVAA